MRHKEKEMIKMSTERLEKKLQTLSDKIRKDIEERMRSESLDICGINELAALKAETDETLRKVRELGRTIKKESETPKDCKY